MTRGAERLQVIKIIHGAAIRYSDDMVHGYSRDDLASPAAFLAEWVLRQLEQPHTLPASVIGPCGACQRAMVSVPRLEPL